MLASEDESRALAALRFSLASDIVELVVLTVDELFLQTLREGVGPARRLWHVLSPDKVSDLLVAGGVGILVLDAHALNEAATRFVSDIKRQFPDLVVVVAGNREAETELARFISDGSIYRFIHKPMSPARARLFADAAVKRFDDRRRQIGEVSAPAAPAPSERRQILLAAAVAALAAALIAAWFAHRPNTRQSDHTPGSTPDHPTSSAAPPLAAPFGSAVPAVQGVLMEAQERLLAKARTALDQHRLDDAAATIETARKAGIATERVAQLATELAAARERAKTAAPPAASASTPSAAASAATAAAASPIPASPIPASPIPAASTAPAPAPLITGPATALLPTTQHPAEVGVDKPDGGSSARGSELMRSARQSIAQDHLIEPENDNAQFYLVALRELDPQSTGLAELTADFGSRLLAKARASMTAQQYEAARNWLDHAAAAGYVSAEADAVRHDVDAALSRRAFMTDVVNASELTQLKSVQPQYPPKAEKNGIEGWVELDFTVTDSGAVEDVAVDAAKPAGVFEAAATAALLQWRYKPLVRDAKPIAARARIRIRFSLAR